MSSLQRDQLNQWLSKIEVSDNSKILDIGGSQLPMEGSRRLKSVGENCKFKILDLEQPHEVKKMPDIEMDLNRCWCEQNPKIDLKYKDYFDIAFCLEVSEYLWNPYWALRNMKCFLKQDGILYMSFHFITPIHGPLEQDFLRYTKWGVEKLMKESGFEILDITTRPLGEPHVFMDLCQRERMRPSKAYKGHNESGYLVIAKRL